MKNKKLILFLIILFPSTFWVILELSTINSKKLPHYGPKKLVNKDSVFYTVGSTFYQLSSNPVDSSGLSVVTLDTVQYPLYVVCFIKQSYKADNYRLAGLSEYAQYKKEKIKNIPFIIVTPCDGTKSENCLSEFEKLETGNPNIKNLHWNSLSFDSLNYSYFKEKPVHIDYSFFVLVDAQRTIRGYYDARYVSEIKRLMEEYQHLRLKEEKKTLINANKIEEK